MKRLIVILSLFVLVAVGIITFGTYSGGDAVTVAAGQQQQKYSCPMHPAVVSDKPGKCSKCGMNLVARNDTETKSGEKAISGNASVDGKVAQARTLVNDAKMELAQAGKYNCCIETPCDECLLGHKNCACATNLKAGKGVCSQCYGGWQRGDGIVKGVDAKSVKGDFHSHGHDH